MNAEAHSFVAGHGEKNPREIALLLSKRPDLPKDWILNQIRGKQKARTKFPFLLELEDYEYPPQRALEQASSEQAAQYKSSLVEGKSLLDLSGGMGLDSWFFAEGFDAVCTLEQNADLAKLLQKNSEKYRPNIQVIHASSEDFLKEDARNFDVIYLDPDRRIEEKRAFQMADCEPNVLALIPQIWKKTTTCLIKLSPMLDIQQALRDLPEVKQVFVYSLKNECKELLLLLEKGFEGEASITCVNETAEGKQSQGFRYSEEQKLEIPFGAPKKYLYDPNASLLKAGAFKTVAECFGLEKIATHTHFYASDELIEDFPGRVFEIQEEIQLKKSKIKKANVICKNYVLKAGALKSKFKIQEGGEDYLLAFRDQEDKNRCFLARRV